MKKAFTLAEVFSPLFDSRKKNAFTLAEVLITLGIIGVVAALTMPSLIVKYQKQQTITKLKKAYSELNQAVQLAEIDYGPRSDWNYGTAFDGKSAENFADKYLIPYMNVVKNCGAASGCMNGEVYYIDGIRKEPNSLYGDSSNRTAKFVVNSGYIFGVTSGGNYVTISIVINNKKEKIRAAKDVFFMAFNHPKHTSIPNSRDSYKENDCNKNGFGFNCLALIQVDSWQIAPDYPW